MHSNLRESSLDSNDLQVVGATGTQGGSAFTYSKIIVSHFQVLLQFSIIMHVQFPKGFQDILDYLSVFKGDLLNYLNLKCAVQPAKSRVLGTQSLEPKEAQLSPSRGVQLGGGAARTFLKLRGGLLAPCGPVYARGCGPV